MKLYLDIYKVIGNEFVILPAIKYLFKITLTAMCNRKETKVTSNRVVLLSLLYFKQFKKGNMVLIINCQPT